MKKHANQQISDSAISLILILRDELNHGPPLSRSEAKSLLQRVGGSRNVVLDFDGVNSIGQAFADEIFRVFANEHPDVEFVSVRAVPQVQQMIRRAEVLRDELGGQLPLPK